MELSSSIGGSLAATSLASPKVSARRLQPQLQFSHVLTSSAGCLMMLNKQCLKRKDCWGLGDVLGVDQISGRVQNVIAVVLRLHRGRSTRTDRRVCRVFQAVSAVQCTEKPAQLSVPFKDFHVSVITEEDEMIQIRVTVSSKLTDSIFDKVFSKHVAAAQPLPGFRRMKGGKTPDVPKEVALHLIGPSKVKKEAIKKIINHVVAKYVEKENLDASKNLKVLQSYEELEAAFEPGKEFCFDAAVHLQ